ncbi:MAG: radical SAM protein [Phycisphaerales bacterium]|nr:radical SAM protein [Phycisphaerales bacterium]
MPSINDAPPAFSDEWALERRPPKNPVDPFRPYAFIIEKEHIAPGRIDDVATVFITNRECPFRCLMCDLWKNTTDHPVPAGAVPTQIRWALDRLPPARHIKLYNSGNFFDPHAIPPDDYPAIADLVAGFETVVVESHPRMIGRRCWDFSDLLNGRLQVAIGLETAQPDVLARLNKRMSLVDFESAVASLNRRGINVRAFILVRPPFMTDDEGLEWAVRSMQFAFDAGVECCVLIPTRGGNGAMESLAATGQFAPPSLNTLESALDRGLQLHRGRVFADLWDIEKLTACHRCAPARIDRLRRTNLLQRPQPAIPCPTCFPTCPSPRSNY